MSGITNVYLITNTQSSFGNHSITRRNCKLKQCFCSFIFIPSNFLFLLKIKRGLFAVQLLKTLAGPSMEQTLAEQNLAVITGGHNVVGLKTFPDKSRLKSSHLGPSFLCCSSPVITASESELSARVRN